MLMVTGCAGSFEVIAQEDVVAAIFGPDAEVPAIDARGRFREIFCAVTERRGEAVPGHRPCEDALRRLEPEPGPTGDPVDLGEPADLKIFIVLGFGSDCFIPLLQDEIPFVEHLASLGYDVTTVRTEGLASGTRNAEIIHATVMAQLDGNATAPVVFVGYSKGATDILEALVTYPELAQATDALVSFAGSIGGSPLAADATQSQANLLTKVPGSGCEESDGGAVAAMRPDNRMAWLDEHRLPESIRYYSVITLPEPERISWILKRAHRRLADIDPRNDSQVIFRDQVLPGSKVLGFVNADHWAVAVPVDRSRPLLARTVIDENAFPRDVLMEAALLYVQEELDAQATP